MFLTSHSCRYGRPLDIFGRRALCVEGGVCGRRGLAPELVAAQVCRGGGGQVSTNVMLSDLDAQL